MQTSDITLFPTELLKTFHEYPFSLIYKSLHNIPQGIYSKACSLYPKYIGLPETL